MTHSWAAARPPQGQRSNVNPQLVLVLGGRGFSHIHVAPCLCRNRVCVSRCRCDGALLRGLRLRLGRGVLRERGEPAVSNSAQTVGRKTERVALILDLAKSSMSTGSRLAAFQVGNRSL